MSQTPPDTPPTEPDPTLGRVIQQLREEQGLSRAELAARASLDERALAGIEAATDDPPWTAVEAIAAGLGVSVQSIATDVIAEDPDTV